MDINLSHLLCTSNLNFHHCIINSFIVFSVCVCFAGGRKLRATLAVFRGSRGAGALPCKSCALLFDPSLQFCVLLIYFFEVVMLGLAQANKFSIGGGCDGACILLKLESCQGLIYKYVKIVIFVRSLGFFFFGWGASHDILIVASTLIKKVKANCLIFTFCIFLISFDENAFNIILKVL